MSHIRCDFQLLWPAIGDNKYRRDDIIVPWEDVSKGSLGKWQWWDRDNSTLLITWPGRPTWYDKQNVDASNYYTNFTEPFHNLIKPYLGLDRLYDYRRGALHVDAIEIRKYNFSKGNTWILIDKFYFSKDSHSDLKLTNLIFNSQGITFSNFDGNPNLNAWDSKNFMIFDLNHPSWKDVEGIGIRLAESDNNNLDIFANGDFVTEERRFDFRFDPKLNLMTRQNKPKNLIDIHNYNENNRLLSISANLINQRNYPNYYESPQNHNGFVYWPIANLPEPKINDVIIKPINLLDSNKNNLTMNINYMGYFPIDQMEEWYYNKKTDENYYYDYKHFWQISDSISFSILLDENHNADFDNFNLEFYAKDSRRYEQKYIEESPLTGEIIKVYEEKRIYTSDNISIITGEGFLESTDIEENSFSADNFYDYLQITSFDKINNYNDLYLYLENIPFNFFNLDEANITNQNVHQKYPLASIFNSINFLKKKIEFNLGQHMAILSRADIQSFYLAMQNKLQSYYIDLVSNEMIILDETTENINRCNDLIKEISDKQKHIKPSCLKIEAFNIDINSIDITLFNSLKNKEIDLSNNISMLNNKLKIDFKLQDYIEFDEELFVKWFLKIKPKKIQFDPNISQANIGDNFILLNNTAILNDIKNATVIFGNYTYKIINKIRNKIILSENIASEFTDAYIINNNFEPILMELDVNWQKLYMPNIIPAKLNVKKQAKIEKIETQTKIKEDTFSTFIGSKTKKDEIIW